MGKRMRRGASTATKYKMRLAKLGSRNLMYGKHHTETTKKRISQSMKNYWRSLYFD